MTFLLNRKKKCIFSFRHKLNMLNPVMWAADYSIGNCHYWYRCFTAYIKRWQSVPGTNNRHPTEGTYNTAPLKVCLGIAVRDTVRQIMRWKAHTRAAKLTWKP